MEQANVQLKQPYRELGAFNRSRITAADLTRFSKILHSPAGQSILTQGESPLGPQSVHQTARPTPGVPSPTAAAPPSTVQPTAPVPPVSLSEENLKVHDQQQARTQVSSPPAPVTQEDEDTDYESKMDDDGHLAAENDRTREAATPVGTVKRTALADGEPSAKKSRIADEAPVNIEPARAVKRSREEAGQDTDDNGGLLVKRPMQTARSFACRKLWGRVSVLPHTRRSRSISRRRAALRTVTTVFAGQLVELESLLFFEKQKDAGAVWEVF